jgi:uncharacterized protein
MVEMELARILITDTSEGQIIVLREKNGNRSFPIVIGYFEAAAIDRHVKEIRTPRPLTHDLLRSVISSMGGTLDRVVVNSLTNETFYAVLEISRAGEKLSVDSRPSDAIALAVLDGKPIFVDEAVLDQVCGDQFPEVS